MKVLLDTNVLLDVLLEREPWQLAADAVWDGHVQGKIEASIAAFTFPTIYYLD